MHKLKLVIIQAAVVTGLLFSQTVSAQQTAANTEPERLYHDGLELYNHKKFGAAQKKFNDFIKQAPTPTLLTNDAQFYAALCALELQNKDGEYLLLSYLDQHPGNNRTNQSYFELGRYYFAGKKFKKAIPYLEKTDTKPLSEAQQDEYHYKLGYSYFVEDNYTKALSHLDPIAKKNTPYTNTAIYYVSHIQYSKKNYETALNGFLKLQADPAFKPVVPYYISQIYYLQGKYDKVIEYSPGLLDSANTKRGPEIARIIGEAYYRTGKFAEAIPYLEKYRDKSGKSDRFDSYQLGYAYYRSGNYTKAVDEFKEAAVDNDSLGQNAHYHLGASYLKLDKKALAREEFGVASHASFDQVIEEDALFNFAKLSYELSLSPYNEAIDAFELYIKKYPKSDRKDEAYGYLVSVYLTTKNYKDALASLEKIKVKDLKMKEAYQKIAFFRGVELYNDGDFNGAIKFFDETAKNNYNKTYFSLAKYWKGEALYRIADYNKAIISYDEFQESPGAATLPEFNKANYNIGYCYFKQKQYDKAAVPFRKYVAAAPAAENKMMSDALLRIGDSYFMNKEYTMAADFYGQASDKVKGGSDYALYQRGFVLGLSGDYNKKIEVLKKLISGFPKSLYLDDAKYEIAQSYEFINDDNQALSYYQQVINDHPKSDVVKNARLKIALINSKLNKDQLALDQFKEIVEKFPGSDEAKIAMDNIKVIAKNTGNMSVYESLLPGDTHTAELDTANYESAYLAYTKAEYTKAIGLFKTYLEKYPNGIFTIPANFYLADTEFGLGNPLDALPHYNYVILKPKSKYTERALVKAAGIYYDKKNYAEAIADYEQLEGMTEKTDNLTLARAGLMRSHFYLNQYQQAMDAANRLTGTEKVDESLVVEAQIITGRSALALNDLVTAQSEFKRVLKNGKGALAAEAKYYLVYITYLQKDYKNIDKQVTELSDQFSSYDYWVAKGYIVLADAYYDQGNLYQAKLFLQSILDNYDAKDDVRDAAQTKMNKIIQEENKPKRTMEDTPDEIDLGAGESTPNVEPTPNE